MRTLNKVWTWVTSCGGERGNNNKSSSGRHDIGPASSEIHAAFPQLVSSDALWNEFLERPFSHSHIPNCSFAGYGYGEASSPSFKAEVNVHNFGAVGDGVADDTIAFLRALHYIHRSAGTAGAELYIPAGRYNIGDVLPITTSNCVLKGDGSSKTILVLTSSLERSVGHLSSGKYSSWSYQGGFLWVAPESSFENLIEYFASPYHQAATPPTPGQAVIAADVDANLQETEMQEIVASGSTPHDHTANTSKLRPKRTAAKALDERWQAGEVLADIKTPAARGDFNVNISLTKGAVISPGELVLMCFENIPDLSLLHHIAGHELMKKFNWQSEGAMLAKRAGWSWPVEVVRVEGTMLTLRQPLRLDIRPEWNVQVRKLGDYIHNVGIESLSINFSSHTESAFMQDKGYNALYLNKVSHGWVSNVEINNSDNGLLMAACKNVTSSGLTLRGGRHHHGVLARAGSHDILVQGFNIDSHPRFGLAVDGMCSGIVWRDGEMKHGTFASLRGMPFEMIHTNIKINNDGRCGGSTAGGPLHGARCVRWNIDITNTNAHYIYQPECLSMGALVGIRGATLSLENSPAMVDGDKGCIVSDDQGVPEPEDLYSAQLELRLHSAASSTFTDVW